MKQEDDRLAHYTKTWNLSAPEPLAETDTSVLFRAGSPDGACVLKLLKPVGIEDEGASAGLLAYWNGDGAVKLLRHSEDALLLDHIDGPELSSMLPGDDDAATKIIAGVLTRLHAKRGMTPPAGLTPLRARFRSLFERAWKAPSSVYARGADVAERLLNTTTGTVALHGDIHHANIMKHETRGWLAIDPKGLVGDPVYDAANTLCNPHTLPDLVTNRDRLLRQAGIMAQAAGFDETRLLHFAFAHACLSASWSVDDGEDPSLALSVADILKECI